jgi:peptide subunit release factor 1 (eRF1)
MATEITTDRLRELAETRAAHGKVLSLFVNLDPREFATPPARATEINAVLDDAERRLRTDDQQLTHDERVALKEDIQRVREMLEGSLDAFEGARGLAIFASGPVGLLEVLKLPRPVAQKVYIGDSPMLEPLARIGAGELWWVVLVDRRRARLLAGTVDGLVELWRVDDETSGRHDQGGWSQSRYQRSIDKEAEDHLRAVNEELLRRLRQTRIEGLLIGGPSETTSAFEALLHSDVKRWCRARFDVDVWNSNADAVLGAARPMLEQERAKRDEELFARLEEGLGRHDRAAAGLRDVLPAVHERRIDTLMVQEGFAAQGVRCPQCGWLGISAGAECPADGTHTEPVPNVVEAAVAAAYGQDAHVRFFSPTEQRLEKKGSIAAVLRF